jgi:hypothetical protein
MSGNAGRTTKGARMADPMIKLDPGGKAPILSYNVPEPTCYSGHNYIELDFPATHFKDQVKQKPPTNQRATLTEFDRPRLEHEIKVNLETGFSDTRLFPNVRMTTSTLRFVYKPNPGYQVYSDVPVSTKLLNIDPGEIASMMEQGKRFNVYRSLFGTLTYNYVAEPQQARPRLVLVETYRLSSFLGAYGAGRTIKTFSLLPGERTKISVKTYAKRETDAKQASSILDSFSQESSDDFEKSVQSEQSDKRLYEESFEYNAEAEAEASWGWGSAKASGGVKGSTNSAREQFAKNVSSATSKHSSKASAKRDVQVETSYEVKEQTGEETSIEREIENINVSRTLNFVFRQMNQEFITLLHLVDVRIAFFNGFGESRREVALPQLDDLLEEVLVDAAKRAEVRAAIVDQLSNIFDFEDVHHGFVEQKTLKDRNGNDVPNTAYLRIKKGYTSTYRDPVTATEVTVPGIILAADKNVLRTDGVIVEALLGQGDALDVYSHGLQDTAVEAKRLSNALAEAEIEKKRLALRVIEGHDETASKLFEQIYPCCPQPVIAALPVSPDSKEEGTT